MKTNFTKIFMVLVLMIFSFYLYSQVFPPPENLFVTETGYATWDPPVGGGPQTVQVDPQAVSYWTGTTNDAAFTDDSEVRGFNSEDGWMMFDTSTIPAGAMIINIQFNGYVNDCIWPFWAINDITTNPLTSTPADLYADIQSGEYNYFMEGSGATPGWRVAVLGGTANADLEAALAQGWFGLGIMSDDNICMFYINFDGWNEANPPFLMVDYETDDGIVAKTRVDLKTKASENRDLFGYNIYLDGTYEGYTTDMFWQYTGLVNGQTYIAGISALYDGGESLIIEYYFIYNPFLLDPPQNLFVDELGYAIWEAPNGGGTVDFTISLTDDAGDGWNGASIDLFVNSTLVLDDITLATGFGPEGFIFAVADGDFVEIYYTEGNLSYENAYYVANNLGYLVVYSGSGGVVPDAYVSFIAYVGDDSLVKSKKVKLNTKASHLERIDTDNTRDLLGYNIYLNGIYVDFTVNLFYQYEDLIIGQNYLSEVSALYDEGESDPIEYEFIYEPYPFPPPENVQVDEYTGLVTWLPPGGMIYGDDFESYNVGEYLAVQSDYWTTWSNNPGSAEDALISDDYALSGTKSVKVDGTTDLVLIMDNYSEGCYSMDLNMYIPTGYCGYYNLQKTNIPGTEWGFQIMLDVDGIASIDGGAAAACVFPFDFDTWMNFEIVVDLDNDLCEFFYDGTLMHSYQWTLGTFGTPGLLSLGGVNMYAWASAGNNPLYYFDDVTFKQVNADPSDELTGYNVYLDGMFITYTTELQCALLDYTTLNYGETYVVGVSAVYDDPGESIIIEVTFCFPGGISPPENLVATLYDYNDVHLEWEPPGGTGEVLAYHSGYDNNGIGTGAAADWMCAARFTADELADYYGSDLTAVNVHIRTTDFSYVAIKVWEGGSFGNPGTEVYSADITGSVLIEDWTEHTLTTPIPLVASNEYWIGYDMSATGDHPSSVDAGPAIAGKGDWMFYTGIWQEISVAFGLDYNWCIEGVVGGGDEILVNSPVAKNNHTPRLRNMITSGTPEVLSVHPCTKRIENNRESRILESYKVYRDGVEIYETFDPFQLTCDDLALNEGTYEYWVTAVYDIGESGPSNIEEVTVVLNPPQNVTAIVQGMYNVFLSWDAPATRDLDYYNVYRDSIQIGSCTSTFYLDVGVPAGPHIYNVTAVYDGGWESEFSNNGWPPIDVGDTPVPVVTELIGNYPNPFNPETTIKFTTENTEKNTELVICNLKGQKVKTLINAVIPNGFHRIVWDGKDANDKPVSSGIYFYKMKTGKYISTKRMILIK